MALLPSPSSPARWARAGCPGARPDGFFLFLCISKDGGLISQAKTLSSAQPPLQLVFYYVQVNFFEHFIVLLTRAIFRAVFTCVEFRLSVNLKVRAVMFCKIWLDWPFWRNFMNASEWQDVLMQIKILQFKQNFFITGQKVCWKHLSVFCTASGQLPAWRGKRVDGGAFLPSSPPTLFDLSSHLPRTDVSHFVVPSWRTCCSRLLPRTC